MQRCRRWEFCPPRILANFGQTAAQAVDTEALFAPTLRCLVSGLGIEHAAAYKRFEDGGPLELHSTAPVGAAHPFPPQLSAGVAQLPQQRHIQLMGSPEVSRLFGPWLGDAEPNFQVVCALTLHQSSTSLVILGLSEEKRSDLNCEQVNFLQTLATILATAIEMKVNTQSRAMFLKRVLDLQEQEKRRIALGLHDEAGQSLTSLLLGFQGLMQANDLEQVHAHVRLLRDVTAQTLDNIRRLSRGLHPTVLEDFGLIAALSRLVSNLTGVNTMSIELETVGWKDCRLAPYVEINVYRIVQEALTNAVRHSGASSAIVKLEHEVETLTVTVSDNGAGFTHDPLDHASGGGLGLHGMKERAALIGGNLLIDTIPQKGTAIRVTVPLDAIIDRNTPQCGSALYV